MCVANVCVASVCVVSVESVESVESVAGVAGMVFSDDGIYVTATTSASPSLNATCNVWSPITEIKTETETWT